MSVKVEDWQHRIEKVTQAVVHEFGGLSADVFNWKPSPKEWSIAQNLDHLITLNATYFPEFEGIAGGTQSLPGIARLRFLARFFGSAVLRMVEPTRKKRIDTFIVWEPAVSAMPVTLIRSFKAHQEELWRQMMSVFPYLDKKAMVSSPAAWFLNYELPTILEILVTHEERHLNQAREVLDQYLTLISAR